MSEAPDLQEWQLLVGDPILAVRVWRVTPDEPDTLKGIYYRVPWSKRAPFQAECLKSASGEVREDADHRPPSTATSQVPVAYGFCSHACGIYALKPDHPVADGWLTTAGGDCYVVAGEVALWGRIVKHDAGYRAEYAYPRSLMIVRTPFVREDAPPLLDLDELAAGLADAYGVECGVDLRPPPPPPVAFI